MADLFSDAWMKSYADEWNNEAELSDALAKINFNSVIGYGFEKDENPIGYIAVENGKVTSSGAYDGRKLNWDLRASQENWTKWMNKGIGMTGLGMAYMSGKLKFKVGDYGSMIKDPRMAGPFIKSFSVMGRVK